MTHLELRKSGNHKIGYIVRSYTKDGRRVREYVRRATDEEIKEHTKAQHNNKKLVPVVCTYPNCNTIFKIPKKQKQKFFTSFPLRYGRVTLPYCSARCRDAHLKELKAKKTKKTPKT